MTDLLTINSHELRIAAVRQHVTIFEMLDRMGIQLAEETQQIRCPFHADNNPSARIFADQNKIWCWTCQRGWDVIDAAQSHLGVGLHEALTWLEQEFSIPGATQGLAMTIKTQLSSRAAPDIAQVADLVEQTLRTRKKALGFERYTRLLYGLDLTVYQLAKKAVKLTEAQARFTQLLKAARQ